MLDQDGQLAQRHLEGDPQAFGALVDLYQTPVLTFIYHTVPDRVRAERLAEEVFVKAHRELHRFNTTTTFSTWIYKIASQVVWQELGRRRFAAVPRLLRRSLVSVGSGVSWALRSVADQLLPPNSHSRSTERRASLGRPSR